MDSNQVADLADLFLHGSRTISQLDRHITARRADFSISEQHLGATIPSSALPEAAKQAAGDSTWWTQMMRNSTVGLTNPQQLEYAPLDGSSQSTQQAITIEAHELQAVTMGMSMTSVLHAAWALTLHIRNGGEDAGVTFGVVSDAQLEQALPMHIPIQLELSAIEWLELVDNYSQQMELHNQATISEVSGLLVSQLCFRTVTAFGHSHSTQLECFGGEALLAGRFVLMVTATESVSAQGDAALKLTITNDGSRVSAEDAMRLLETMRRGVEILTREQHLPISEIVHSMRMAVNEREMVMQRWNAVAKPSEVGSNTCHALIEAQSLFCHSNPALMYEGETLSYTEFEQRTAKLASALSAAPDSIVGLCVEKSVEEVAGIVGIVRGGAAYVPLDPGLPQERLLYIVQQSRCNTVVAQRRHCDTAATLVSRSSILIAEDVMNPMQTKCSSATNTGASSDSLIYVLFTSGSTGKPKGVMVEHGSLRAFLTGFQQDFSVTSQHMVPYWHLFTGDPCVNSVWCTLTCGACLMVARVSANLDFSYMQYMLLAAQSTGRNSLTSAASPAVPFLLIVPPVLSAFLDWSDGILPHSIHSLYVAGDKSTPELAAKALQSNTNIRYVNGYGPSEVSVNTNHFMLHYKDLADLAGESIPIGQLMLNTTAFVLDQVLELPISDAELTFARFLQRQRPTSVDIAGELYLGNAKLARGYVGRPDLTTAAFNSARAIDNSRLYRTGDRARWKGASGDMEFVGRVDFQVMAALTCVLLDGDV